METNNISSRIRELREENQITQLELAKALYVKQQTIAQWEKGERDLKTNSIIDLANFFRVTTDYLLGLSDYKTPQAASIGDTIGLSDKCIAILKYHYEYLNAIDTAAKRLMNEKKGTEHNPSLISSALAKEYCEILNDFICGMFDESINIILDLEECKRTLEHIYAISDNEDNYIDEHLLALSDIAQVNIIRNNCIDRVKKIIDQCIFYDSARIITITKKYVDIFEETRNMPENFTKYWNNVIHEANRIMEGG